MAWFDFLSDIGQDSQKIFGWKHIKEGGEYIAQTGKQLLETPNPHYIAKKADFEDMVKKMKLTDLELEDLHNRYKNMFYILLLGAFLCLCTAAYALLFQQGLASILVNLLPALSFLFMFLVFALNNALKAYQIRHRNFVSWEEFKESANKFPSIYDFRYNNKESK